ncbi:hypothetical protein BaRGS_00009263 [Batillaria attramentaria]|uniref:Uncharacterized protein n=1 Tax=Batillaria attramentaria TaxID=370345 RepID=A0ABD0LJZ4_9CAEN
MNSTPAPTEAQSALIPNVRGKSKSKIPLHAPPALEQTGSHSQRHELRHQALVNNLSAHTHAQTEVHATPDPWSPRHTACPLGVYLTVHTARPLDKPGRSAQSCYVMCDVCADSRKQGAILAGAVASSLTCLGKKTQTNRRHWSLH